MDIFNVLTLIGGLSLFLFGMNIMGQALERRAGGGLKSLLGRLTTNRFVGLLTGLVITAVVQSSSATTVMVVGFVNSGLMTLRQSINVIIGANIGTTVTAWILSLAGISSGNFWVRIFKPSSFTPVLALIGIILYMSSRSDKKKDTGMILLGFATLMTGMETMTGAVSGLKNESAFQQLFLMFENPILGVLAGAVLTAIIQSSSASVGILQSLAVTGQVSYGAAIPIIMGQNIGTCVTAMFSSVGATRNAKRAAVVHLLFNVIGTVVWLLVFWILKLTFSLNFLENSASLFGIAVSHTVFNILCTLLILPFTDFLEKIVIKLVQDSDMPESKEILDERLLITPAIAMERCRVVAEDMAKLAVQSLKDSVELLHEYTPERAADIRKKEENTDNYEDILGTYLVKLSSRQISEDNSEEAAKLLKVIGDFERISDHGVNILEAVEELRQKKIKFTEEACEELKIIVAAVNEVLDLSLHAFLKNDLSAAALVEALEQVIDKLKEQLRTRHINRLQQGLCTMDAGFVWSDLLTDLERTSDHCSNIAGCVIDMYHHDMNMHETLKNLREDNEEYRSNYRMYAKKYYLE
jgi:phosphate:Na+ symporter